VNDERSERRTRTLTGEDVRAIIAAFEAFRSVPHEEHREHHEFISHWIERQRRKEEIFEKVKAQLAGWGVITMLGAIGYTVWEWLKRNMHP
jgi:hypothetical protein